MNLADIPVGPCDVWVIIRSYRKSAPGDYYHVTRRTPKKLICDQYYEAWSKSMRPFINERQVHIEDVYAVGVSLETFLKVRKVTFEHEQEGIELVTAQRAEIEPIQAKHRKQRAELDDKQMREIQEILDQE